MKNPAPTPRPTLALLAAALAVLGAGPAAAADLEVSPVLVELGAGRRTALLALRNGGAAPARFQAKAFSWTNGADGKMQLAPTREVAVFPPLVELAPGESRNLRLGTDAPAGAVERAWRVTLEEMPREDAPSAGARVRVLTRVGLPVFLAPAGEAVARGEISFLEPAAGKVRFALRNAGTVRLRPSAVSLALVTARGETLHEATLEPWYVLAREQRVYEVEPPPAACARAAEVVVTVQVEGGPLTGRAPGACRGP